MIVMCNKTQYVTASSSDIRQYKHFFSFFSLLFLARLDITHDHIILQISCS